MTNKIGFFLQLGYFKHPGNFFEKPTFRQRDMKFVKQRLNTSDAADPADYLPSSMAYDQLRIVELSGWYSFNAISVSLITEHVQLQTQRQIKLEQVFSAAVDFCWQPGIEVPSYHQLVGVIADSFNIVESAFLNQLENSLQPSACDALDAVLSDLDGLKPLLGKINIINLSLGANDIQKIC